MCDWDKLISKEMAIDHKANEVQEIDGKIVDFTLVFTLT